VQHSCEPDKLHSASCAAEEMRKAVCKRWFFWETEGTGSIKREN